MKFLPSALRIAILRAPKNLKSNRLWIYWGRTIYVRSFYPQRKRQTTIQGLDERLKDSTVFIRWTKYLFRDSRPSKSTAIFFTELGMLGNMARRLANGLTLASLMDFGFLVIPRQAIFQGNIFGEGFHQLQERPSVFFGTEPTTRKNPVEKLVLLDLFKGIKQEDFLVREASNWAWEALHGLLVLPPTKESPNEEHLTIHLRGGDVFGDRKPRTYGQPPLSFYEFVLDDKPWKGVTIVHQDELNPVLPGLIELCRVRGISPQLSSGSLQNDISTLLEGVNLVGGRGTFVPALAGLSRNCQKLYFFEDKCQIIPEKSGVQMIRVIDSKGEYKRAILDNNWENSESQHNLMVSYPVRYLGLVDSDGPEID